LETISLLYKHISSLPSCSVSVIYCKSASVCCCEKQRYLVLTVKTAVLLGKRQYQPSLKIYVSLAFTNNEGLNDIFIFKTLLNEVNLNLRTQSQETQWKIKFKNKSPVWGQQNFTIKKNLDLSIDCSNVITAECHRYMTAENLNINNSWKSYYISFFFVFEFSLLSLSVCYM